MENINISLGIELDKSQFNEVYLQNEVDKSSKNVKVKVDNVEIGDVSRDIQNDLNDSAARAKITINNVSMEDVDVSKAIKQIEREFKFFNDTYKFDFNGDSINLKEFESEIKDSIEALLSSADINFSDATISGIGDIVEEINEEIARGFGESLQSDGLGIADALDSETKALQDLAKKHGLQYSDVFIKEIKDGISDVEGDTFDILRKYANPEVAIKRYKDFIHEVQGIFKELGTGRSFAVGDLLDVSELEIAKEQLKNFFSINEKKGTDITVVMDQIAIKAKECGVAFDNIDGIDSMKDKVLQLAQTVENYKKMRDFKVFPKGIDPMSLTQDVLELLETLRKARKEMDGFGSTKDLGLDTDKIKSDVEEVQKEVKELTKTPQAIPIYFDFEDGVGYGDIRSLIESEKEKLVRDFNDAQQLNLSSWEQSDVLRDLADGIDAVKEELKELYYGSDTAAFNEELDKLQQQLMHLNEQKIALDELITYDESVYDSLMEKLREANELFRDFDPLELAESGDEHGILELSDYLDEDGLKDALQSFLNEQIITVQDFARKHGSEYSREFAEEIRNTLTGDMFWSNQLGSVDIGDIIRTEEVEQSLYDLYFKLKNIQECISDIERGYSSDFPIFEDIKKRISELEDGLITIKNPIKIDIKPDEDFEDVKQGINEIEDKAQKLDNDIYDLDFDESDLDETISGLELLQNEIREISQGLSLNISKIEIDESADIEKLQSQVDRIAEELTVVLGNLWLSHDIEEELGRDLNERLWDVGDNVEIQIKKLQLAEDLVSDIQKEFDAIKEKISLPIAGIKFDSKLIENITKKIDTIAKKISLPIENISIDEKAKKKISKTIDDVSLKILPDVKSLENLQSKINKAINKTSIKVEKVDIENLEQLSKSIQQLINKASKSTTINVAKVDKEKAEKLQSSLQSVLNSISKNLELDVSKMKLTGLDKKIKTIGDAIEKLQDTPNNNSIIPNDAVENATKVGKAVEEVGKSVDKLSSKKIVTDLDTGETKEISDTYESLGRTVTETTKFLKDGSASTTEVVTKNLKKVAQEKEAMIKQLSELKNIDSSAVESLLSKINNIKVGSSVSELSKLKEELLELKTLDANTDKFNSTIDNLTKKLKDVSGNTLVNSSVFDGIQKQINSLTIDSAKSEIEDLYKRIDQLKGSSSSILEVQKAIDTLENALVGMSGKEGNEGLSFAENVDDVAAFTKKLEELRVAKEKLENGEFLGVHTKKIINEVNSSMGELKTTIGQTAQELNAADKKAKALDNLAVKQKALTKQLNAMSKEGYIDTKQFDTLKKKIDRINLKTLTSDIAEIKSEFNDLIRNGKQSQTLTNAIEKLQEKIDTIKNENAKIIDSESAVSGLNTVSAKMEELVRLKQELSNGNLIGNTDIKKTISDTEKAVKSYSDTLTSLASNKSLFDEISRKLDSVQNDKIILGVDVTPVENLRESLQKVDLSSEEASEELNRLKDAVDNMDSSNVKIQKLQSLMDQLKDKIDRIKDRQELNLVTASDISKMEEMQQHVNALESAIDNLNNNIDVSRVELEQMTNAAKNSMKNISSVAEGAASSFSNLGSSINRVFEIALGNSISEMVVDQIRGAKDAILDIDEELTMLKRVSGEVNNNNVSEYTKYANETAIAMGRTTAETLNATSAFVKMGYSLDEASGYLAEYGLTLSNVADMDVDSSVEAIVSTLKGFGVAAEETKQYAREIIDLINESGNKFAMSSSDMADMLRLGSASMSLAGNSLQETASLFTASFEVLQDSSKVANGFKTISMRLRGIAEEGEELNPKLGELLKKFTNVDLTDANGQFRSTYDVIKDLGKVWGNIDTNTQAYLLEQIAGKNQANVLASLLQNYEQLGVAMEKLGKASDGAGSAAKEQEAYMNSLAGKINALKEEIVGLWTDLVNSKFVGYALEGLQFLIAGIRSIGDAIGTLPTIVGLATGAFVLFTKRGRELSSTISTGVGVSLLELGNKFKVLRQNMQATHQTINKTDAVTVKMSKTFKNAKNASLALSSGLKTSVATAFKSVMSSALLAEVAVTAFNAALTMGLSMLVSGAMTALSGFLDKMITTSAELKELNSEILDSESNSNAAGVQVLIDKYDKLTTSLSKVAKGSEQYKSIEEELATIEKKLVNLYPDLNSKLEENTEFKWKNVAAMKAMTEEQLKQEKINARVNLADNKVDSLKDVEKLVNKYKEQKFIFDELYSMSEEGQNVGGVLGKQEEKLSKAEQKLKTVLQDMVVLEEENGKFEGSVKLMADALGVSIEELYGLSDAAESVEPSIGGIGDTADDTTESVEKLASAFGNLNSPIELLQSMIEEYQEYGAVSNDTYASVLTSGNEYLIALLGDNENFLSNANETLAKLTEERSNIAKNLIDTSYDKIYGSGVSSDAGNTSDAIDGIAESFDNVTESAKQAGDAIETSLNKATADTSALDMYKYFEKMYSDIVPLSDNLTQSLMEGVLEYVNTNQEALNTVVENTISAEEAKAQAAEMWKNQEVIDLANMVSENADMYEEDVVNWANAVINKTTDDQIFSDSVYRTISDLISYNSFMYSEDLVNWANALDNKNINNVNMINSIMQSVAQMILNNSNNYSADTVNWAKAVTNKDNNNANMCTSISANMANAINNMIQNYERDNREFERATNDKINMYNQFQGNIRDAFKNSAFSKNSLTEELNKIKDGAEEAKTGLEALKTQADRGIVDNVVSTYNSNYVEGGNYVGNTAQGSDSDSKSQSSKDTEREVSDLEDLVDRYYKLNNELTKIENQMESLDLKLDNSSGKDRIKLLQQQIELLNKKKVALQNINNEQKKEAAELKSSLSKNGFSFNANGDITNYSTQLAKLTAQANKLSGDAKQTAIDNVKKIEESINRYTDLILSEIPSLNQEISSIGFTISDINKEIKEIEKSTTIEDMSDRYWDLNNALKAIENQITAINTALDKATGNDMVELLDKQIQLYIKQGKALESLRKEYQAELSEIQVELKAQGVKFDKKGNITNYEKLIDSLVKKANKITNGEKQEEAVENIEKLIELMDQYTELYLDTIPDLEDQIESLSNSVIDAYEKIADTLAEQRDKYIENLEKETDALKKELQKRKELLEKQWEQEDAEDELHEKQQALNELEDQLTVALRTGDEELVKSIREQIAAAQKEINDFIRDQERDYISDKIDSDIESVEENLQDQIDYINETLSDEELLNLVKGGVRDLTEVLEEVQGSTAGVRTAFAAVGTTISTTWINALDTFIDKLNSIEDLNLGLNLNGGLSRTIDGVAAKAINVTQGDIIVQGNLTEDILPVVQSMIDTANNNLINDINQAFSR